MSTPIYRRVVVPIATEADARTTCDALLANLGDAIAHVYVVHVIEKGDGGPAKTPLEAQKEDARAIFDYVRSYFGDTDITVETQLRYGSDVVDEVVTAAEESDATAIAFVPRPSNRFVKFLTGDRTRQLAASDRVPVLALPREGTSDAAQSFDAPQGPQAGTNVDNRTADAAGFRFPNVRNPQSTWDVYAVALVGLVVPAVALALFDLGSLRGWIIGLLAVTTVWIWWAIWNIVRTDGLFPHVRHR